MQTIINLKLLVLYIQYKCIRLFNKKSDCVILNDFLSKENVLFSFFRNYLQNKTISSYITFCNINDTCDLICKAFVWQSTKEGQEFWNNIDNNWITKRY